MKIVNLKRNIILAMFLFEFCGCSRNSTDQVNSAAAQPSSSNSNEKNIRTFGEGNSVGEIAVGERFKVTMSSNPSTGYHWDANTQFDEKLVKLISQNYEAPNCKGQLGCSGYDQYLFEAIGPGTSNFELQYCPPGKAAPCTITHGVTNEDVAPETLKFTITIK